MVRADLSGERASGKLCFAQIQRWNMWCRCGGMWMGKKKHKTTPTSYIFPTTTLFFLDSFTQLRFWMCFGFYIIPRRKSVQREILYLMLESFLICFEMYVSHTNNTETSHNWIEFFASSFFPSSSLTRG